jgi:hypothetical protein
MPLRFPIQAQNNNLEMKILVDRAVLRGVNIDICMCILVEKIIFETSRIQNVDLGLCYLDKTK